jgi:Flp pilus assembly protein TadG
MNLRRFVRARRGQAVVEMALAAPLLTLMLFGLVDFGRAYFQYIALVNTAREGARYAAYGYTNLSNASTPPQDTVQGRMKLADGGLNIQNNAGHIQINFYDTTVTPEKLCAHYDYATNSIKWNAPYTAPTSGQAAQSCPREGDAVRILVVSDFTPITPLMANIMGNPLQLLTLAETRIE